jgi:hypothetical protein
MHDQTIWLPPRATAFTELCELCEEEHPERSGSPLATVSGNLRIDAEVGWAICARGHTVRVLRMGSGMPAGALR